MSMFGAKAVDGVLASPRNLTILMIRGSRSTDSGLESSDYLSDDDHSVATGSAFIKGFIPE